MINPQTRRLLQEADWSDIMVRLLHYTQKKVHRYWWATASMTTEDLVQKAISRTFNGDRIWNPETQPELLKFLYNVIDSLISHLYNSCEHKRVRLIEDNDRHIAQTDELAPDEALMQNESLQEFIQLVSTEIKQEPELQDIFEAISCGYTKSSEIATYLELK